MLTVVQPSRGGSAAGTFDPGVGSSSRVMKYRIPTINSRPATMAAMIGTLLVRLPDVPVPDGGGINVGSFSVIPTWVGCGSLIDVLRVRRQITCATDVFEALAGFALRVCAAGRSDLAAGFGGCLPPRDPAGRSDHWVENGQHGEESEHHKHFHMVVTFASIRREQSRVSREGTWTG